MPDYPVISSLLILGFSLGVARISDALGARVIRAIFSKTSGQTADQMIALLKYPRWYGILIVGQLGTVTWINPLPNLSTPLIALLQSLLLVMVLTSVTRATKILCDHWREVRGEGEEVISIVDTGMKVIASVIAIVVILAIWDIDLTPVLASAGVAGVVLALAAKESLANIFGAISLFFDQPFKPGDYIVLDSGERGRVITTGLRSTRILTRDDVEINIPNMILSNSKIINESAPEQRFRIRIEIGVAYGSDLEVVEETLLEVARKTPKISRFPEPRVRFRKFGDSALEMELLCWARQPEDRGLVIHQLNKAIYGALGEQQIVIPFPQRDIHIHSMDDSAQPHSAC